MAEYKFLGEEAATQILIIANGWANDAQTAATSAAKTYTDAEILKIPKYQLPAATSSTIGGVKPGAGLEIDTDGTLKVVLAGIEVDPTNIAKASKTGFGVVKAGDGVDISEGVISVSHPDVYTKIEANERFQTAAQVEVLVSAGIAKIVDGAPATLDTLKEIADTLNKDTEGGVVNGLLTTIANSKTEAIAAAGEAADDKVDAAKTELNAEIAKKATPDDVSTAKTEAISAAATDAATKYVAKADMPTFVAYTAEEIQALADSIFADKE